jgi:hypothetical protein
MGVAFLIEGVSVELTHTSPGGGLFGGGVRVSRCRHGRGFLHDCPEINRVVVGFLHGCPLINRVVVGFCTVVP